MSAPFLNLSACAFVPLGNLPAREDALHERSLARGNKGTVLRAEEGSQLGVAGADVRETPGLDLALQPGRPAAT